MFLSIQVIFCSFIRNGNTQIVGLSWRTPRLLSWAALWCFVSSMGCLSLLAQDDPFDASPATPPPAAQTTGKAAGAAAPKESNVVVLSIRDSKLTTPQQYGQAFVWLARIQRFDEIGRYLEQIKASNWDLAKKAQLLEHTDSALWLHLVNRAELTADQKLIARDVLDAAYQQARTPQQLDQWIAHLSSESAGD